MSHYFGDTAEKTHDDAGMGYRLMKNTNKTNAILRKTSHVQTSVLRAAA
jgi:hypothetical protein